MVAFGSMGKHRVTVTKDGVSHTSEYDSPIVAGIVGGIEQARANREVEIAKAIAEGRPPPPPINTTAIYLWLCVPFLVLMGGLYFAFCG
ncbi:MAG TPA: hypothetical protein VGI39_01450 [Polyangiaceae bacterium]